MSQTRRRTVALVGPGRAGTAFASALEEAGRAVVAVAGRDPGAPSTRAAAARLHAAPVGVEDAGHGVDLVILATPDAAVALVARALAGSLEPGALVVHLSGSQGVEALRDLAVARPDARLAAVHPLQTFPEPFSTRSLTGVWFAVEGDPGGIDLVHELGGRPFRVADRVRYHAAAAIAANHLVALIGQVERLAREAGAPLQAFAPLMRSALDHALESGPAAALTGPVARGDAMTVARHLDALSGDERAPYAVLAREALRLTGRDDPALAALLADPAGAPGLTRPEAVR